MTLLALIFVRGMYGTGFVSAMDEQRVRLFVSLCTSLNWKLLLMFDAICMIAVVISLSYIHHACAAQTIQYNGDVDSALISAR